MGRASIESVAGSYNIPWRALVREAPELRRATANALFTPAAQRKEFDQAVIGVAQEIVDVKALEVDEKRKRRQAAVNQTRGSRVNGQFLLGGQPRGRSQRGRRGQS